MRTTTRRLIMLALVGMALTGGCKTDDIAKLKDFIADFDEFTDHWNELSVDEIWDKLRGKEAKQDDNGWNVGAAKIKPEGKPAEWEFVLQLRDIPKDRCETGAAERGLVLVQLDNGKVYPYIMPGGRNCLRMRAKGGEVFNVHCGDAIWTPIPDGEVELRLFVKSGKFDMTLDGMPMGRKDRSRGIRNNYLPVDIGDGKLKAIIVDPWAGDGRVLGAKWKASEVRSLANE